MLIAAAFVSSEPLHLLRLNGHVGAIPTGSMITRMILRDLNLVIEVNRRVQGKLVVQGKLLDWIQVESEFQREFDLVQGVLGVQGKLEV